VNVEVLPLVGNLGLLGGAAVLLVNDVITFDYAALVYLAKTFSGDFLAGKLDTTGMPRACVGVGRWNNTPVVRRGERGGKKILKGFASEGSALHMATATVVCSACVVPASFDFLNPGLLIVGNPPPAAAEWRLVLAFSVGLWAVCWAAVGSGAAGSSAAAAALWAPYARILPVLFAIQLVCEVLNPILKKK
jgi:hypothetical protein